MKRHQSECFSPSAQLARSRAVSKFAVFHFPPDGPESNTLPPYQLFQIDGKRLVTRSCDAEGKVRDELVVEK